MIPTSLRLKNFLSYGEAEQLISFENYHLICLSGKNGNGKSALLDAITWAVWGQARKTSGTSKPDDGLLRLGASHMHVIFDFILNDKQYRLRREYMKTNGKPYAVLEFSIYDDLRKEFVSLTDKTIRATQEKIERTISLDYETYVNSAFLRQGSANEFSRKSPKDRKKILSSILNLDQYDGLQSAALERARNFTHERKVLQEFIAEDEKIVAEKNDIISQRDAVTEKKIATEHAITRGQEVVQRIEKQLNTHQQIIDQYKKLQKHYDERRAYHAETKELFSTAVQKWRQKHRSLLQQPHEQVILDEYKIVREQEQKLRVLQQSAFNIKESLLCVEKKEQQRRDVLNALSHKREQEVIQAIERYTFELAHSKEQQGKVEHQYSALKNEQKLLRQHIEHLQKKSAKNRLALAEKESLQSQFDKRKQFYQQYAQKANWLHAQQKELAQKQHALVDHDQPSCPMCEQMLTAKRKHFLASQFGKSQSKIIHQYERLSRVVTALKVLLTDQHERLSSLAQVEKQTHEYSVQLLSSEKQFEQLAERLKELQQQLTVFADQQKKKSAAIVVEEHRKKLYDAESTMTQNNDPELLDYMEQKAVLLMRQEECLYSANEHANIQARLERIEKELAEVRHVEQQRRSLSEQLYVLHERKKMVQQLANECLRQEKELQSITVDHAVYAQLEEQRNTQQKIVHGYQQEKDQILTELGKLQKMLDVIEEKGRAITGKKKQIECLNQEIADYQAIGALWGKNGIQALLIEEALPEIEQEANQLLSRLTNNQAQIFIESLRDLKKGGVRETLDIKISDTAGVRPYEMFSGGEAFRIDFALRIAISKLLSRRAGASLQVLIIDEGFGSQDEEGLQRLMDALHAIQRDFEKIIVVSHLQEFKENFPVHFMVEKKATGSVVTVEHRG